MDKTACYIDGFNLYHAIDALKIGYLKWLNLRVLSETLLRDKEALCAVVYFSAYMVWDNGKFKRHKEYIAALKTVGVEPIMSRFQSSNRHCRTFERYCNFREEKQTDVAFASRVICDSLSGNVDRVILMTADSDQVPTIAALRALTSNVHISLAIPPGRKQIARELIAVAHDFTVIEDGRLQRCIFPRNVRNERGQIAARCPASYQHPHQTS